MAVTVPDVDPRLRDPLSEVTRRERKFLLAVSVSAIVLIGLHENIRSIPSIGISDIGSSGQRNILIAVAAVVLYGLGAFVIYAWSDFVAWRQSIARSDAEFLSGQLNPVVRLPGETVPTRPDPKLSIADTERALGLAVGRHDKWTSMARLMSIARAVWDFFIPCVLGVVAFAMTSWKAYAICVVSP